MYFVSVFERSNRSDFTDTPERALISVGLSTLNFSLERNMVVSSRVEECLKLDSSHDRSTTEDKAGFLAVPPFSLI